MKPDPTAATNTLDLESFKGHTPGPWFESGKHVGGAAYVDRDGTTTWTSVASVFENDTSLIVSAANKRLIAAAPALLSRCSALEAENAQLLSDGASRIVDLLRSEARCRRLETELAKIPTDEPDRIETDNHGDTFSNGWESGEWSLAKTFRAALSVETEGTKP